MKRRSSSASSKLTFVVLLLTTWSATQADPRQSDSAVRPSDPQTTSIEPSRTRMAQGNGIMVKVGQKNQIQISIDGVNWVTRRPQSPFSLYDVAFGNGMFVIVGNEGAVL